MEKTLSKFKSDPHPSGGTRTMQEVAGKPSCKDCAAEIRDIYEVLGARETPTQPAELTNRGGRQAHSVSKETSSSHFIEGTEPQTG